VRRLTRFLLVMLAIGGGLFVLIAVTSNTYRIRTAAMEPTLRCPSGLVPGCTGDGADRILVSRLIYRLRDPHRGDVVVYRAPIAGARRCGLGSEDTFVHRIVAEPGERWSRRQVPARHYVVLGDNEGRSCDSRVWGYLSRDRIVGPVIAAYWPLDRISIR
jgi:signal peptidase I